MKDKKNRVLEIGDKIRLKDEETSEPFTVFSKLSRRSKKDYLSNGVGSTSIVVSSSIYLSGDDFRDEILDDYTSEIILKC